MLVSVGAMLAGYTRLTYSLVVIMLETTQSINIFVPMLIAVLVSRKVGGLFTGSIYEQALKMKKIPVLPKEIPKDNRDCVVNDVMRKKHIITVPTISTMSCIKRAILSGHNAFPVLNSAGCFIGLIPETMLIILAEQQAFYDIPTINAKI